MDDAELENVIGSSGPPVQAQPSCCLSSSSPSIPSSSSADFPSSPPSPPPRVAPPQLKAVRLPDAWLLALSAFLLFLGSLLLLHAPPQRTTNAWGVHSFLTYAVHSTSPLAASSPLSSAFSEADSSLPVCPPPTLLNETHLAVSSPPHHRMAPLSWGREKQPRSSEPPPGHLHSNPSSPTSALGLPIDKGHPLLDAVTPPPSSMASPSIPSSTASPFFAVSPSSPISPPQSSQASAVAFGTSSPVISPSSSSSSSPALPLPPSYTFLISFPRSGNTMLRKLLEDATGVLTGSHYGDASLYRAGLRGELSREHTLLLKHHLLDFTQRRVSLQDVYDPQHPHEQQRYRVQRFIYATRNPLDSLVSYWQYVQHHSHEDTVDVDTAELKRFVLAWLPGWAQHIRTFTSTFFTSHCSNCSSIVVKYEQLIAELHQRPHESASSPSSSSTARIVPSLLSFLGYPQSRPCRAPSSSHPSQTYRVKTRRSLLNPNVTVARTASYAAEVKALMTCDEWLWVKRVAGLEMKALGYWPDEEEAEGKAKGARECDGVRQRGQQTDSATSTSLTDAGHLLDERERVRQGQ